MANTDKRIDELSNLSSLTGDELVLLQDPTTLEYGKTTLANVSAKSPVTSVAGKTGAVSLTKDDVGLSNAENTADVNKPISSATQAALNSKEGTINPGNTGQYFRGDKTWQTLDKSAVGLGNVDNTNDLSKPISTATQAALDTKATTTALDAHANSTANPHSVTKAQVGLGNVDNTSDADKPVSTAQQTAIDGKQDSDATLTALAAHNTNGILTQTAADTFTGRTITGTANQITVTNGDGVAGNPTLSLPQNIHTGATPQFSGVAIVSSIAAATLTTQSANDWSSGIYVKKRGTTGDANAAVANGAEIGYHTFSGWDGSTYKRLAYVITRADGAITPTTGGGIYKINVRSASGVDGDRLSLDSVAMSLAVNSNPSTNSAYTLGTSSLYWKEAYANKLFLNSTATLDGNTAGEIKGTGIFTADNIKRGTGFPEGVVTANVGSIYIDTAVTNGASSWIKKSGTGNTGWQVLEGDTGWRNVSSQVANGWAVDSGGYIYVKRTSNGVSIRALGLNSSSSTSDTFLDLGASFGVGTGGSAVAASAHTVTAPATIYRSTINTAGSYYIARPGSAISVRCAMDTNSTAAWPTTLPGTAV